MTAFRADLTADYDRLIAHLLPGDVLFLTWSPGEVTIVSDPDSPWVEVFDNAPIPRVCRYGSEARLVQNTLVRQRPPVTAAARAVRHGGVVYVVTELRQETSRFGEAYGPPVRLPAGHLLVEADELVAAGGAL